MKRSLMIDLVNAYFDNMVSGNEMDMVNLIKGNESVDTSVLVDLATLTNDLAALLVPAKPSPAFVRNLGRELATAAVPNEIEIGRPSRKKLWLGALLSGSLVSAAGVILLVLRRRGKSPVVAG